MTEIVRLPKGRKGAAKAAVQPVYVPTPIDRSAVTTVDIPNRIYQLATAAAAFEAEGDTEQWICRAIVVWAEDVFTDATVEANAWLKLRNNE